MDPKIVKRYLKLIINTVLAFCVYTFFLLYTPTIFEYSRNYAERNFFDSQIMLVGQTAVRVKTADSPEERMRGLSNSKPLKDKQGMFFIFEEADKHGIWMKDMNYPIDIIWINKHGAVIKIEHSVSPDTYPEVFKPETDALYILEIRSGLAKETNLLLGDTIDLY